MSITLTVWWSVFERLQQQHVALKACQMADATGSAVLDCRQIRKALCIILCILMVLWTCRIAGRLLNSS